MEKAQAQTYAATGVNYDLMDPFKIAAQRAAAGTADMLKDANMEELPASRGESAYIWEAGDRYMAMVTEGLGTKNLVADAVRPLSGRTHYDAIAQDTVAMIVNDLAVVGARPNVVTMHLSAGSSDWFRDEERNNDLITGWANACRESGATWGGGETPTLKGILMPDVVELSGSAVGTIEDKRKIILGGKLQVGDSIIMLKGSGIHANGLTMARSIADIAPEGYATPLSDGTPYGEALLAPTPLYPKVVRELMRANVAIHYMANITGHGWRKLMRAPAPYSYHMHTVPEPQPVFQFLQEYSGATTEEMYGNFNMGAGYAVFVKEEHTNRAVTVLGYMGQEAVVAGEVRGGPKQVVIEPLNIAYEGSRLQVR
jgi:phosphoribosylformylglycinamidine cyclo-ligase